MPLSVLTKTDFTPRTADDAARHFARKAALSSDLFERLSTTAQQRAFRIAGVHKANLIQRARDIVHRGIEQGRSWHDVRIELLEVFDTEGVPAPAIPRLRLMFQQNAHQAFSDSQREVLDEMTDSFPFRQYMTVGNGTPGVNGVRATHAALHGLVFKATDPFWDKFTPPWEFGCRCTAIPLTERQARALGVKVRDESYVLKRIRVQGQKTRGIRPDTRFVRGEFNLAGIDREQRGAVEEMLQSGE